MKGQIFILASVMILIALLLLQNAIRPLDARPKSNLLESFSNIRGEMTRTVDMSLLNGEDVSTNLDSFIVLSKDVMRKRGYAEDASYTISSSGRIFEVQVNLNISAGNSFIQDQFIINRTVYP
jgi:hypothetical protein